MVERILHAAVRIGARPDTPSATRHFPSTCPSSFRAQTSWWASAQSTPTRIIPPPPFSMVVTGARRKPWRPNGTLL